MTLKTIQIHRNRARDALLGLAVGDAIGTTVEFKPRGSFTLGNDADTTAAVAGQLADAFYGESGISEHWLKKLAMAKEIGQLAEQLAIKKLTS